MQQNQIKNSVSITAIKAFTDNYIWAITSKNNKQLVLVDPGDAQVCINHIEQHQLKLTAILVTHHHSDHVGGIDELLSYSKEQGFSVEVYAPAHQANVANTSNVKQDDVFFIKALNLEFNIIELPGHTLDHVAYLFDDNLFCGDTLFSGGCGRIFEGTAEQMLLSLEKLSSLPENTRVYCTHEYTLTNLSFALTVDPSNSELVQYYNKIKELRENNQISLPSSIFIEKKINPFLRCFDENIKQSAEEFNNSEKLNSTLEVFTTIRQWKDQF